MLSYFLTKDDNLVSVYQDLTDSHKPECISKLYFCWEYVLLYKEA